MIEKERVVDSLKKTDQIVDANVLSIGSSVTSYDEFMDLQQGMNQQLQDIAGHIGQLSAEDWLISNSMIELKKSISIMMAISLKLPQLLNKFLPLSKRYLLTLNM